MMITSHTITAVAIPVESAITRIYRSTNLADAYTIDLPAGTITDPEPLARHIFSTQAGWVGVLVKLRDAMVSVLGLKTTAALARLGSPGQSQRIGPFKIYATTPHEIVLGEDDSHLDFRVSVLCVPLPADEARSRLVLSTVVHCHNRLGRAYIFLIAPFHRAVVKSALRRAARAGWPRAGRP